MGSFDYVYTYDEDEPVEWQSKSMSKDFNDYHIIKDRLYLTKYHRISFYGHLDARHRDMYDQYLGTVGVLKAVKELPSGETIFGEQIPLTVVGAMEVHKWHPNEGSKSRIYVWDYDGTMHMDEYNERKTRDGGLIINQDLEACQAFDERAEEWNAKHLEDRVEEYRQKLVKAYNSLDKADE